MELQQKKEKLLSYLKSLGSVAVAYSGGVDSSLLLRCAHDVLGDHAVAVTATSATYPERELKEAQAFTREYGIKHRIIVSEELDIEGFQNNPPDRCYLCKNELFGKIRKIADEEGLTHMAEGSNMDDLGDYRPGLKAAAELGAVSPLRAAGLTKEEIRTLSKEMGLKTWNKPSFACLSSRVPYGQQITREKLAVIDHAEQFLMDLGFRQVRVRHHGDIARIEVAAADMPKMLADGNAEKVYSKMRELGFVYAALDLKGYRTGSMNAKLGKDSTLQQSGR